MSSTNKTSLGLNQWDATDPIQRVDFNKDNEIINEALGRKANLDDVDKELAGKMNKTLLQRFAFSTSEKYVAYGGASYSKMENGMVMLCGSFHTPNAKIADGDVIATLPEGFRPFGQIYYPAAYYPPFTLGYVYIARDGNIGVKVENPNTNVVHFNIVYIAQ